MNKYKNMCLKIRQFLVLRNIHDIKQTIPLFLKKKTNQSFSFFPTLIQ